MLEYIQKDSSYVITIWCKSGTTSYDKDTYRINLDFSGDKVTYDFSHIPYDMNDSYIPITKYSYLYYTTGTDTTATFKGEVDDEVITVHLSEINDDTMKHVIYKGDSTDKYYEVTIKYIGYYIK